MKNIKIIVIYVIIICTFIIYPITSLARVANSGADGGTGKTDQYGRPETLEDFIKIYNVNFSSAEELEDYLDDNYTDKFYELKEFIPQGHTNFADYRKYVVKEECYKDIIYDGNKEQSLQSLENSYRGFLDHTNTFHFTYNVNDEKRIDFGKFEAEIYGYYWAFEYSIINGAETKDEYTVDDFYAIYEKYKKTQDGSKEQDTAIRELRECFNNIPTDQRTEDMAEKLNEAENRGIINDVEQTPGDDAQVPIINTPEETYEFDPEDWSPDSTTKVKGANLLKNIGNDIIGTVTMIGSIVSVITLIILGIKYMLGSIEERAEYKKTLTPYVIGAVMVFGITNIINFIIAVVGNMQ